MSACSFYETDAAGSFALKILSNMLVVAESMCHFDTQMAAECHFGFQVGARRQNSVLA
jgi:hypothetical protein